MLQARAALLPQPRLAEMQPQARSVWAQALLHLWAAGYEGLLRSFWLSVFVEAVFSSASSDDP